MSKRVWKGMEYEISAEKSMDFAYVFNNTLENVIKIPGKTI